MKRVYKNISFKNDISFSIKDYLEILNNDFSNYENDFEFLISEFYGIIHEYTWESGDPSLTIFIFNICKAFYNSGIKIINKKLILIPINKNLKNHLRFQYEFILNLPKQILDNLNYELSKVFEFEIE